MNFAISIWIVRINWIVNTIVRQILRETNFEINLYNRTEIDYLNAGINLKSLKIGHHLPDDIFKCVFTNEKFCILIPISLKFVHKVSIDNKSVLVQIMAWWQSIIWTNADPVHLHIYAALRGDE